MFSKDDMDHLQISGFEIVQANQHDATIHSSTTGHDWVIVSFYDKPNCFLLHRHARRDSYHRQKGHYKSLGDALEYIAAHEKWVTDNRMLKVRRPGFKS